MLLWGIAFELIFTGAVVYVPPLQHIFGTAALDPAQLALIAPFPVIVWGADELVRWVRRRHRRRMRLAARRTSALVNTPAARCSRKPRHQQRLRLRIEMSHRKPRRDRVEQDRRLFSSYVDHHTRLRTSQRGRHRGAPNPMRPDA